jgi:hypothetical protein
MASEIKVDTISEKTGANGVTIDGVNIKDSALATAGSVPLSTIDIDGGTDIGAAIVDADLFIIDDGAGGTNRKTTASRLKTYAGTTINNATANEIVTIGSTTTELDAEANLTFSGSALQCTATLTVGVDDTGHDVKFFGATSGSYMLWDESADDLNLVSSGLGVGAAKDLGAGIHIKTADSGASANSAHDELIIEGSGDSGLCILSGASSIGAMIFADSGDSSIAQVSYDHSENAMKFGINGGVRVEIDSSGNLNATQNITLDDDKGITWGSGGDWHMGAGAGESILHINTGNDTDTAQGWDLEGASASTATVMSVISGETKGSGIRIVQDQNDDAADQWIFGQYATDGAHNTNLYWTQYSGGSWDNEMLLEQAGHLTTEGSMTASSTVDYAEFFEWKTELANDTAVTNSYGLTVVLDNDKVRLAELGEEADVLGAVRPNNTSAMVGGTQTFQWKDRYLTDVWGKTIMEEYTLVDWDETITELYTESDKIPEGKNVGDVRRTYLKHHKYPKDRIPAKKLKPEIQLNKSEHDWHTLADNLTADDLVVPTTDEEKTAANYTERTTYKKDKGDHKKGDKLMRKKINPSYVSSQAYLSRDKRRKEWCIVGLLGQVPIRDTAIVPTHWKKMKNLESGIDLYYIK